MIIVGLQIGNAQDHDFRNFSWGSSREKIRAEEKATLISKLKNGELEYKDKLLGSHFRVLYIFDENNKLISGTYGLARKYSNPELYNQDYSVFLALLTEKYGKMTYEKETWIASDSGFDKNNRKQGIADRNLNLYAVWDTERTRIKITLISIGNDIPSMQIHYTSNALNQMHDLNELKAAMNKL